MYIVRFNDNTRHSAWTNEKEANKQKITLEDHGYKDISVIEDSTVNIENGHYYV